MALIERFLDVTINAVSNSNEGAALARKICEEVERDLHISEVTYSFVG